MVKPLNAPRLLQFRVLKASTLLAVLLFLGCGPSLVPVEGVVTLDGELLPDAAVTFKHVETGVSATGTTDQQGRFQLRASNNGDGALPGLYEIVVMCVEYEGVSEATDGIEGGGGGLTEIWITPKRYASAKTSGLTTEVCAQMPDVRLDLKSQD